MINKTETTNWGEWAMLPLRFIIGFGFVAHGYAKLSNGPEKFAVILEQLGVPAPILSSWATTLIEIAGGVAILAGAFVPFVSIPLIIIMLVALVSVHLQFGFSSVKLMAMTAEGPKFGTIGYEVNLLYIAGLIALSLAAPTLFSVDAMLRKKRPVRA